MGRKEVRARPIAIGARIPATCETILLAVPSVSVDEDDDVEPKEPSETVPTKDFLWHC